jgi:hypothetical protein
MELFDETVLISRLDALTPKERTAFALACARRLQPFLRSDSQTQTLVRESLALLETSVLEGAPPPEGLLEVLARVEDSPELDADPVASTCFALRAWVHGASREAAWAAKRAYDARDQVVWEELGLQFSDPGAEERVLAHPLIQYELRTQREDLNALSAGRIREVVLANRTGRGD